MIAAATLCIALPAQAVPIAFGDFDATAVIYDFNAATPNALTAGDGFVTFSDGEVRDSSPGSNGNSYSNVGSYNPPSGGFLRFDFSAPVSAVGFTAYYNNDPVLFRVFDASNNLLDSSSTEPTDCGSICGFIGLDVGANLISYALASVPLRDNIHNLYIDDVIYQSTGVPAPATLVILGLGLLLIRNSRTTR
ncbi:MAG: hypothetical protein ACFHX7_11975 [Pseudomonadota bacterium]